MGRQRKGERVNGPYKHHWGWRIEHHDGRGGEPVATIFATEAQAKRAKELLEQQIAAKVRVTLAEAIETYETHLREKGNKERFIKETLRRLRDFFGVNEEDDGGAVASLTAKQCGALYDGLVGRLASDSHRNYLAEAKTFAKWCIARRWLRENPLEAVQGKGKRKHGKPQLTRDEARKWDAVALAEAETGSHGALAAMLSLYLGVRAEEITLRKVRDVDDGCSILRIEKGKTDAADRQLTIDDSLRPLIQRLVQGRAGDEWLFPSDKPTKPHWRDWIAENVRRICKAAGVPVICAHGMRGTHGTLSKRAGMTSAAVAEQLGHTHERVTEQSYIAPEAVQETAQARTLAVLKGGKK